MTSYKDGAMLIGCRERRQKKIREKRVRARVCANIGTAQDY